MSFVIADRVKETSTSIGTGDFTLNGAVLGHKTFASRLALYDTFYYCIQAVDANGVPSGDWETGTGIYSAANTLTRLAVSQSSNNDSEVDFSAGSKQVFITLPKRHFENDGEVLLCADTRVFFVSKSGSDSNSGRDSSPSGAFLSIQKALVTAGTVRHGDVEIHVANGTYNEALCFPSAKTGRTITLTGDIDVPGNVVISSPGVGVEMVSGCHLRGFRVIAAEEGIIAYGPFDGLFDTQIGDVIFGSVGSGKSDIVGESGAVITVYGVVGVSASARAFLTLTGRSQATVNLEAFTLTNTPAFSSGFIEMSLLSYAHVTAMEAITGTATGKRYDIRHGSILFNQSAVTLPGGTAGTAVTGAQYTTT